MAVACVLAGVWQVQRLEEKHGSNSELRHNSSHSVTPVAGLLTPDRPADPETHLRRVSAHGRYDAAHEFYVRQRQVDNQPAYLVVTPLKTDEGPTLLVVRGWTLVGDSATETPKVDPPPNGEVTVTGRVAPSEDGPDDPGRGLPDGQIERINVPALGRTLGTSTYGAYVELADQQPAQQGLRMLPAPDLSNPAGGAVEGQHLAYVVQWFLFAALALVAPPLLAWFETRRTTTDPPTAAADPIDGVDPVDPSDPVVLADPADPSGSAVPESTPTGSAVGRA